MSHSEPSNLTSGQGAASNADADKRARMHNDWDNLIEDLIEDAQQRGLFDNLAGAGQPLNLNQNLYEGSQALSNQLLKDNNLRPAWIMQRTGVQERIERLRHDITREWQRFGVAFDQAVGTTHQTALAIGWDDLCRQWAAEIEEINKLVESFNLRRPNDSLEMFKLRLDYELARTQAPRRLL